MDVDDDGGDVEDEQLRLLLSALPSASDPIDGHCAELLAAVVAISPREKYTQRGTLLMGHARAIKCERAKAFNAVAPHIEERIQRFHEDYAIRADDRIQLDETRPVKLKGTGRWRQWLPAAVLRASWGLRPRRRVALKPKHRIRVKSPAGPHHSAPTVASARTI
jgi:hypothetical protein